MTVLKMYIITILKLLIFLLIGFIITEYVLKVVYESVGIHFIGNVWVNWFGVSYLLYFLYEILNWQLINKNNFMFQKSIKSVTFWILFLSAIYVIFIPFIKGENPF